MEFSSLRYFSFCSTIGQVFLLIAFLALKRVLIPFHKFIWWTLKSSTCIALFSYAYAFFLQPLKEADLARGIVSRLSDFYMTFLITCGSIISLIQFFWYCQFSVLNTIAFSLLGLLSFPLFYIHYKLAKDQLRNSKIGVGRLLLLYPTHTLCCALFTASLFSLYYLASCRGPPEAMEVLLIVFPFFESFSVSIVLVLFHLDRDFQESISRFLQKIEGNYISMIIGLLGYVVSQYCIQEKSVPLLVMVSSFAIYWLSTLALAQSRTDFGILNFLIGAILDCAISLFGLHIFTWIVSAACFIILFLRKKLDSVTLRYPPARFG